jgi:hypothetical protein
MIGARFGRAHDHVFKLFEPISADSGHDLTPCLVPHSRTNQRTDTNENWHERKQPTLHRYLPMQYTRQQHVLDDLPDSSARFMGRVHGAGSGARSWAGFCADSFIHREHNLDLARHNRCTANTSPQSGHDPASDAAPGRNVHARKFKANHGEGRAIGLGGDHRRAK